MDEGSVTELWQSADHQPSLPAADSPLQAELKKMQRAIKNYDASHANLLLSPLPAVFSFSEFLKMQFLPEAWQIPMRFLLTATLLFLAVAAIKPLGRLWGRKIALRRPALVERLRRILEREGLFAELVSEIEFQAIAQPEQTDIVGKLQGLFRPGTSARHLVQRLISKSMKILRELGFESFGYSAPIPYCVYEVKYAVYQLLVEELRTPAAALPESLSKSR